MSEIIIFIVVIIIAFIAVAWYARYSSEQRRRALDLDLDHIEPDINFENDFSAVFEQELEQQTIGDIDSEPAVSLSSEAESMIADIEPVIRQEKTIVEPQKQASPQTRPSQLEIVIDDDEDIEPFAEAVINRVQPEEVKSAATIEPAEPIQTESSAPRKADDDLVIALTIMAPENVRFSGKAVKAALDSLNLHFGDLQIYHRYTAGTRKQSIFSVANILDPGTLLPDSFVTLTTPGLLIFSRLPGPINGLALFDDLLDTAHAMTEKLGGILCDDSRQPISQDRLEAMRSRIFDLNFALHTEQNNDYSN